MICTTIQNRTLSQIYEVLPQCEMAEIRLDNCPLTLKEIEELFTSDIPMVATCRIAELMKREPALQDEGLSPQSREIRAVQIAQDRLIKAVEAGARYVDVEIEAPKHMSKRVRNAAHESGTVFIRSFHDFNGTDSPESLMEMVRKCRYHGADAVKIVTYAHSQQDVEAVMSLYGPYVSEYGPASEGGLVAFCMGEEGRASRMDCLRHGAPYTYAALNEMESAAPGQWTSEQMKDEVYGGFSFIGEEDPQALQMPVSKSFAQRSIIAAALADGVSHLRGYTPCGDNEAALTVARALGAEVTLKGTELIIKGIGASLGSVTGLRNGMEDCGGTEEWTRCLHVGESGLLTRMMIPLMAQLCTEEITISGEKTLLRRPLTGADAIMTSFGMEYRQVDGVDRDVVMVPFTFKGPLKTGRTEISGKHGSQLISGLLMALPFAEKNSTLVVREPKSIPYMFITLEVLKKFGIRITNEMSGGRDFLESDGDWSLCKEMTFKVKGGQKFKAADIDLEGDWSAAANFLVAGAIFGKTVLKGLDTTSLQADLSIMDILMDAGASLSQLDGDRGEITVQRAPLRAFETDASNCPDLFPVISVLAAFCQGTSRIRGVGRLANKESDRARAIVEMLTRMGVNVAVEGDEMVIKGYTLVQRLMGSPLSTEMADGSAPSLLKGGEYTSYHDHRMVMALKVAQIGADGPIVIDDEECVAKSFPQFHGLFEKLTRKR